MLAIRMQRTGRKKLAQYRVIVQESQFSPNSGRVVANLGHYNPHTKETVIDVDKASEYLKNGAQPSERVVKLFTDQKIKLPSWVSKVDNKKKSETKNPEKLRKNQSEESSGEPLTDTKGTKEQSESQGSTTGEPKEEVKAEEPNEEAKAEEPKVETDSDESKTEDIDEKVSSEPVVEAVEEAKDENDAEQVKEESKESESTEKKTEDSPEESEKDSASTEEEKSAS